MFRACRKCGSSERYADGHCVPCRREANRRWSKVNPKKKRKAIHRWNKTNPEKRRLINREANRRRNGWAPGEPEKAEAARSQVTCCACCGSDNPRSKQGWAADHDHQTGLFRAYLCHPCNVIVGFVERYELDRSPSIDSYLKNYRR